MDRTHSKAICETCKRLVDTHLAERDYTLLVPPVVVPCVRAYVCSRCDRIVSIPHSSTPVIREAREAWWRRVDAAVQALRRRTPDIPITEHSLHLQARLFAGYCRTPACLGGLGGYRWWELYPLLPDYGVSEADLLAYDQYRPPGG